LKSLSVSEQYVGDALNSRPEWPVIIQGRATKQMRHLCGTGTTPKQDPGFLSSSMA